MMLRCVLSVTSRYKQPRKSSVWRLAAPYFQTFSTTTWDDDELRTLACIEESVFDARQWKDPAKIQACIKEIEEYNQKTKDLVIYLKRNPMSKEQTLETFGPSFFLTADRPCPDLTKEFPEHLIPSGVPVEWAKKLLERAYWHASGAPWIHELGLRCEGEFAPPSRFVQRWHGLVRTIAARERIKNGNVDYGDVIEESLLPYLPSYPDARSLFANNAKPPHDLHFGSTHVAVGFNDLGELLSANFVSSSLDEGPLRFIGYEKSPFSVAKYSVLAEMLRQDKVDNGSAILQVWFSSTWSNSTLQSFRHACHAALPALQEKLSSARDDTREAMAKVVRYVEDWVRSIPFDADTARRNWFLYACSSYSTDPILDTLDLAEVADRVALVRYMFAGEVFDDNDEQPHQADDVVGNITFWGGSNKPMEEPILLGERITTTELTESLLREKEKSEGSNVLQCIVNRKIRQINRLKELVSKGRVDIDLRCGVLGDTETREGERIVTEIKSLHAKTMSWSNIVDYFIVEKFHELAFQTSNQDTQHYGYSMNWPVSTFGADIVDYGLRSDRCGLLDTCHGEEVKELWHLTGKSKLFMYPSFKNPFEQAAYLLASRFHKKWATYFTDQSSQPLTLRRCWFGLDNSLLRSPRTVYLHWHYEPEETVILL